MKKTEVAEYFAHLIMKCVPKSKVQALGEVSFSGDNRLHQTWMY
jgi:hypothetical protein